MPVSPTLILCILASVKLRSVKNPVLSSELENMYKISGSEVRDIVRHLRRDGEPIAISKEGYFFAKSYSEIEPTLNDLTGRAQSLLNTVSKLKQNFLKDYKLNLFGES